MVCKEKAKGKKLKVKIFQAVFKSKKRILTLKNKKKSYFSTVMFELGFHLVLANPDKENDFSYQEILFLIQ